MSLAGLLQKGMVSAAEVGDIPYHCTSCGACEEACLHDNQVALWMLRTRNRLFENGRVPNAVAEAAACFGVAGNQYGKSGEPALVKALEDAGVQLRRSGVDVYLAGCESLHDAPKVVTSLFRVLNKMTSIDLTVTRASALCCGAPLAWAGEHTGFVSHARRFASAFGETKRVIAHDPACAHTLRTLYPHFGVDFQPEVWTLYGFIGEQIWDSSLSSSLSRSALGPNSGRDNLVFEPCHLVRTFGERDRTRALLDQVLGDDWGLFHHNGVNDCCGAAGLLPLSAPETAWELAHQKVAAFVETGARSLIALSPRCSTHLRRAAPALRIRDLVEVVLEDYT